MNMKDARIQDRSNAHWDGKPITTFSYFERRGDAYFFAGQYSAPGHDATPQKCLNAALEARDNEIESDDD